MKSKKSNFMEHRKKLRIEGMMLHKLISECLEKNIYLRDIKFISEFEVILTITDFDFARLMKIVKSKYKITVLEEKGIIPTINAILSNKALLAGIAIFFIILYYQSLFISEIRIYGYQHFTEAEIRSSLRDAGIYEGSRKFHTKDEINQAKLEVYQDLLDISFIGIVYKGNLAEITIVEGSNYEKNVGNNTPCNIIADRAAYIVSVIPRDGMRVVSDGAFVNKGDVLISGTIPLNSTAYGTDKINITERYVHAEGTITAHVPYYINYIITPDIIASDQNEHTYGIQVLSHESDYDMVKRVSDRVIRKFIKENCLEKAQITNKSLNFAVKKNIIEVSVIIETLQEIGIEQEIMNGN